MAQTKAQLVVGLNVNASAPASALQIDASGNVNLDSNTLYVDATNNRVGVGTTSPSGLLSVHEPTASTANYINITNAATGASSWSNGLIIGVSTSGAGLCWQNENLDFLFGTNNTERLRITSDGKVGIGTSSPGGNLTVTDASTYTLNVNANAGGAGALLSTVGGSASLALGTNSTERVRITAAGNVGIGTTSPGSYNSSANDLVIAGSDSTGITISATSSTSSKIHFADGTTSTESYRGIIEYDHAVDGMLFATAANERARIDSSGRLLVGTSTERASAYISTARLAALFERAGGYNGITIVGNENGSGGSYISLLKSRGTTTGSNTLVANGDNLGGISFEGTDGTAPCQAASILTYVDGTPGANDMPGRIVFATTADGASSSTERMRIAATGSVTIGTTEELPGPNNVAGASFYRGTGLLQLSRSNGDGLLVNRITNDGNLVVFQQDATTEGTISVSGTTVSYNGAHLSRWSQLPTGAEREEILRGTVLSNIDEMCEWGKEENEQLNRMKVSDVEGDKNVSGVFQAWDDDDDTYTNDFYCAMTGDFIIRIAAGVTVERGDLLMSAGDGTAKPQDDDIIRSKTIAKVTSTNVSCTYDDGSYCVPCVLMAC